MGSFSQSSSVESYCGPGEVTHPARGLRGDLNQPNCVAQASSGQTLSYRPTASFVGENPNRFRLERFGKAMTGTGSWEAPGAIFNGLRFNISFQKSLYTNWSILQVLIGTLCRKTALSSMLVAVLERLAWCLLAPSPGATAISDYNSSFRTGL